MQPKKKGAKNRKNIVQYFGISCEVMLINIIVFFLSKNNIINITE